MADKKKTGTEEQKKAPQDKPAKERKSAEAAKPAAPKVTKEAAAKAKTKTPGVSGKRTPLVQGTVYPKQGEISKWRLVDAAGQTLGRLSSYIASALMGKDKAGYTRFADTGDFVVVVNAEKIVLTGKKWADKQYHYHTNYPGGIKTLTAQNLLDTYPERVIERAVYGMLPKGHMGRHWFKKLRVFKGPDHPHAAQQPVPAKLPNLGSHAAKV